MGPFAFSTIRQPPVESTAAPRAPSGAPAVDAGSGAVLRSGLVSFLLAVVASGLAGCQGPRERPAAAKTSPALAATAPDRDSAAVAFTSFRVRNWTVEDGLLGRADDIAQTPDGYQWVATSEGLFRFDGARFVGFTTATVPAFRSNDFNRVDVLPSGDLWVGSRDRWTYRLRGGAWSAYSVDEALGGDRVHTFVEDGEGTVWVANSNRRVVRFDGTGWAPLDQRIRASWAPFVADAAGTV